MPQTYNQPGLPQKLLDCLLVIAGHMEANHGMSPSLDDIGATLDPPVTKMAAHYRVKSL